MTKKQKELREHIRKLFIEQYPDYFGAKAGANSLAAVNDGVVEWKPSNGCHAAVHSLLHSGTSAFYSSLWCRYEDLYEAALDYWGYLLGPKGPWSKYMTDIDIIKDDKGRPKAVGTFNVNQLANAWIPCMMQCRVPQESSNKLRSYWHWRKSGMDEPTSLYLSEHLALHISGYFSKVGVDYTHAFNWKDSGIDLKRLITCDPIIINDRNIKEGNYYGPVCDCWVTSGVKNYNEIKRTKLPPQFNFKLIEGDIKYTGKLLQHFKAANDNEEKFSGIGFVEPKLASVVLKEASSWH